MLALLEPLLADAAARGGAAARHALDAPVSPAGLARGGRAWTPLTRAAYRGHANAVRALLRAGASRAAVTDGRDAAAWAAEAGHAEVVDVLRQAAQEESGAGAMPTTAGAPAGAAVAAQTVQN